MTRGTKNPTAPPWSALALLKYSRKKKAAATIRGPRRPHPQTDRPPTVPPSAIDPRRCPRSARHLPASSIEHPPRLQNTTTPQNTTRTCPWPRTPAPYSLGRRSGHHSVRQGPVWLDFEAVFVHRLVAIAVPLTFSIVLRWAVETPPPYRPNRSIVENIRPWVWIYLV
ncbi:hypothetical protein DFP72DRAFT_945834 [Ephemerocybe angulata]|uniref:Uncharacterized protein n=1 Tax=Ephemerocybe angulata TaxID=980116 RepID=A0A8H6LRQ0_9AGAR|nr:hypothetical protein DFP72DRAFT_945834 [Tulosesus angulatus]